LVEPDSPAALEKLGNSLYRNPGGTVPAVAARVRQGMVEGSNADPMTGMVDLIQTGRSFEMNMNLLRTQDEMLGQLIQSVPRR
jgi:flagellar basal-body rod protein FlgF